MKKILLFLYFVLSCSFVQGQCLSTVSSGDYHNFGIKSNGTLWVWGWGAWGQLGDGTEADHWTLIQLGIATNWQQIFCNRQNTLAVKTNGTLWSTGDNTYGQLGLGSSAEYINVITQVGSATNWQQVANGGDFTLAVKTNGTLWSWGRNDSFQLGDGACCSNRLSPLQVGTATDWAVVGAAWYGSGLAIKTNGTLWGWGLNSGLVGPSTVSARQNPTQIGTDIDWATMSVGGGHALALKTNGTLWSWGTGGQGQTGDNLPANYFRQTPLQIGTATWLKVAAGWRSSYGIKTDGTLWAWGENGGGQLGDGTTTNQPLPVQIGTDTDWVDVSGGWEHTVALKANGALWSWGKNGYGQLGNGSSSTTPAPIPTYIPVAGCTLDTAEFEQEALTLSPNPATTEISFRYAGNAVVDGLVIYDITGRAVYTSHPVAGTQLQASLPIGTLQSGTYILTLQAKGKVVVSKRFVKE